MKLIVLDCCCGGASAWYLASKGLQLVGQDEVVILLAKSDDEFFPPVDIFAYFNRLYDEAVKGTRKIRKKCKKFLKIRKKCVFFV